MCIKKVYITLSKYLLTHSHLIIWDVFDVIIKAFFFMYSQEMNSITVNKPDSGYLSSQNSSHHS